MYKGQSGAKFSMNVDKAVWKLSNEDFIRSKKESKNGDRGHDVNKTFEGNNVTDSTENDHMLNVTNNTDDDYKLRYGWGTFKPGLVNLNLDRRLKQILIDYNFAIIKLNKFIYEYTCSLEAGAEKLTSIMTKEINEAKAIAMVAKVVAASEADAVVIEAMIAMIAVALNIFIKVGMEFGFLCDC